MPELDGMDARQGSDSRLYGAAVTKKGHTKHRSTRFDGFCDEDLVFLSQGDGEGEREEGTAAFEEVARRLMSWSYRAAVKITGSEHEAEAAIAEMWFRAYRSRSTFAAREGASVKTWLRGILWRAIADARRSKVTLVSLAECLENGFDVTDRDFELYAQDHNVRAAVRELEEKYPPLGTLIAARWLEERTWDEIRLDFGLGSAYLAQRALAEAHRRLAEFL